MAKGKRKLKRDIQAFFDAVDEQCPKTFAELVASIAMNPKTRSAYVKMRLEYEYGKPKEIVAHTGSITVYDAVAKARARVLQFEQARKKPELIKGEQTESESSSPNIRATGTDGES